MTTTRRRFAVACGTAGLSLLAGCGGGGTSRVIPMVVENRSSNARDVVIRVFNYETRRVYFDRQVYLETDRTSRFERAIGGVDDLPVDLRIALEFGDGTDDILRQEVGSRDPLLVVVRDGEASVRHTPRADLSGVESERRESGGPT